VNSNLFFNFWCVESKYTHVVSKLIYVESKIWHVVQVDFGPITVSKLHMWYVVSKQNYKFLKSHSVMLEKQGIFDNVLFHSLACYFENCLCRSDFASCCFATTPCGFENTPLVETISYHILPIISIQ
jgi:hypothetical protein